MEKAERNAGPILPPQAAMQTENNVTAGNTVPPCETGLGGGGIGAHFC